MKAVKSEGKSKKREDARGIEHREWLVWLKEDKVSELKYCTVGLPRRQNCLVEPPTKDTMCTVARN
jgi:hypothetical protein